VTSTVLVPRGFADCWGRGCQLLGVAPCPACCGLRAPGVELGHGRPALGCVFQEQQLALCSYGETQFSGFCLYFLLLRFLSLQSILSVNFLPQDRCNRLLSYARISTQPTAFRSTGMSPMTSNLNISLFSVRRDGPYDTYFAWNLIPKWLMKRISKIPQTLAKSSFHLNI